MTSRSDLEALAHLLDVAHSYVDVRGVTHAASTESLIRILAAVGAPIATLADVPDALHAALCAKWQRTIEPVWVAWDAAPFSSMTLRLPADWLSSGVSVRVEIHDATTGTTTSRDFPLDESPVTDATSIDGMRLVAVAMTVPHSLPVGYHHVTVTVRDRVAGASAFVAPQRAFTAAAPKGGRFWGAFAPVWALHSATSFAGVGDFSDLRRVVEFIGHHGGHTVATLPILAAFLDDLPFDPSPYMPASRLAWNEFYLDLSALPELSGCESAARRLSAAAAAAAAELGTPAERRYVDYRAVADWRVGILRDLSAWFFDRAPSAERRVFDEFVAAHPAIADYARFRAILAKRGESWRQWPSQLKNAETETDFGGMAQWDEPTRRLHLYAQWRADQQLADVGKAAESFGPGLLLDYPLGVHPDGYDAWRFAECFLDGCSAGAPPDWVHKRGQDWGFAPLNPAGIRATGYRYFIDCIRHQTSRAGILRVDHVMGLHRLWCVPRGMSATEGVYVHYRPDEFYAVLAIESHRHRCTIVGEDLGTVPPEVPVAMQRHDISGLRVLQRMLIKMQAGDEVAPLIEQSISSTVVTSINTHDMPMFGGFLRAADLDDSEELGLLDADQIATMRPHRRQVVAALRQYLTARGLLSTPAEVSADAPTESAESAADAAADAAWHLAALLALGRSDARLVLVTLEDLWQEMLPQNVPGTVTQRPNWRRRMREPLETWMRDPSVIAALAQLRAVRRTERPTRSTE